MYALLLAFRYLRTRLIPLVAIGAVGLCVALVVVVVSIMSGFLHQMERAGKTLIGDVVVTNGLRGLPDPEGFIAELKQNEAIAAATPVVDTFATIRMPYDEVRGVQVWWIDPDSFDEVTGFAQTLHWTPEGSGTDWSEQDFRRDLSERANWLQLSRPSHPGGLKPPTGLILRLGAREARHRRKGLHPHAGGARVSTPTMVV